MKPIFERLVEGKEETEFLLIHDSASQNGLSLLTSFLTSRQK